MCNCDCLFVLAVVTVVQQIKLTADQVEKLAPQVASAALSAHNNPRNQHTQQHLTLVKDEWTAKVKQLTAAIDDVTDAQELLTASGLLICSFTHSVALNLLLYSMVWILFRGLDS